MTAWHDTRVTAAARALAEGEPDEGQLRCADSVVLAADRAVGGVVPIQEYERLALQFSAWRVRALQTDKLLQNALHTLDRIANTPEAARGSLGDLASATAAEVRAMLDVQREVEDPADRE